MNLFCCWCLPL